MSAPSQTRHGGTTHLAQHDLLLRGHHVLILRSREAGSPPQVSCLCKLQQLFTMQSWWWTATWRKVSRCRRTHRCLGQEQLGSVVSHSVCWPQWNRDGRRVEGSQRPIRVHCADRQPADAQVSVVCVATETLLHKQSITKRGGTRRALQGQDNGASCGTTRPRSPRFVSIVKTGTNIKE